ncbi:MAG: tetratricopeptide repeat protein [Candidatus Sumerlaeota bacterium]
MLTKLSNALLVLSIVAAVAFDGWMIRIWQTYAALTGKPEDQILSEIQIHTVLSLVVVGVWLVGYLISFDSKRAARPFLLICVSGFLAGGTAGFVAREAMGAYEVLQNPLPAYDLIFAGLVVGMGAVLPTIAMLFEAANRTLWSSLATRFDEKQQAGLALTATRLSLLFKPGQTAMLRSVALAGFRKGNRAEAVQTILNLYKAGRRDPEILEALCKYSSEQHDSRNYLRFLRELHETLPNDDEIRETLIEELIAQNMMEEALALVEKAGVRRNEEGLVRYANLLLAKNDLPRAVETAQELGQIEGIPFRQSQKLLREVLSRTAEYVPAINLLAAQAERMALREQRVRWLEKSLEADPKQLGIRAQLISIYREMGQSVRLEDLLHQQHREAQNDNDTLFELIQVMYQNEKVDEAKARLAQLIARADAPVKALMLDAQIKFEEQQYEPARASLQAGLDKNPGEEEHKRLQTLMTKIDKAVLTAEVAAIVEEAHANPDNSEMQLSALRRLTEGGHLDKVLALIDQFLTRHPGQRANVIDILQAYALRTDVPFNLLNLLADLLAASNRYDEALGVVQLMSERAIDKVNAMREGAQKILRKSPHHLNTLRVLGDTYQVHGRHTEMIHSYSLYLAQGGEETEQVDRSLAKAYISLGDYENARRFASQLLAVNPKDVPLLKLMIPLAVDTDHPEEAADYLKLFEMADARDPEMRKIKTKVDLAMGQRRFAFLQREQEAGKGGPEVLEQLGDIAMSLSNYNDAITYFQRASRERDKADLQRRCTAKLALAYMKKRLDDLCTDTLRDITITLDDDPKELDIIMSILYDIGVMMQEAKMYEKSEKVFKQICKIDAGYRDVLTKVEGLRA